MDETTNKEDPDPKKLRRDTHAMPPQEICDVYRKYQKMDAASIEIDDEIVDFARGLTEAQRGWIVPAGEISSQTIASAMQVFKNHNKYWNGDVIGTDAFPEPCVIYEHKAFPGLRLLPSLLPPECQMLMLDSILHRDLANPLHKTNLNEDYIIPYPRPDKSVLNHTSFFAYPQFKKDGTQTFLPINESSHLRSLNTAQFLQKKLRWLTLGTQYDWTTRSYSFRSETPFPPDISALVTKLFDATFVPESGVVLIYSPKDYMPVHRDVSEECERGLASFSLGCDGLFIIAQDESSATCEPQTEEPQMLVVRVRSGDVVQMDGPTRWAWHAMPKVLADTCPDALKDWPVRDGTRTLKEYERWRGYMRGKRLNISCRQVWG